MIKILRIKTLIYLLFFTFIFACKNNTNKIEYTLTGNNYKYWRVYCNGVKFEPFSENNTIYRFDSDGSVYEMFFNFDSFNWELVNSIFSKKDKSKFTNSWKVINDSIIKINYNEYHIKIKNRNIDSVYIILRNYKNNNFTNNDYYVLLPFNSQVENYFNFRKIKKMKNTNLYFSPN
jgi:hypothetical protein